MRTLKVCSVALALLALSLVGATQVRADGVDSFVYQFGGNTFTWQIPENPTITPDNVYPFAFTVPNLSFTENGVGKTGTLTFFSTTSEGGFDLWNDNYNNYFCNALGPQLYTGPESAPTLLTGTFTLVDFGNGNVPYEGNTLSVSSVPEPSALSLLAIGMVFGLAIFALKKN